MPPYLSQIARLLKSILLIQPESSKFPSAQFFPGKPSPFPFTRGIGFSWWYSDDTFHAVDAVAALTIESSPSFRDCDLKTVCSVITSTIQEHCLDRDLFDGDAVFLRRHKTLFDCRKASPLELAKSISNAIAADLTAKIGRRCTIYAVPRFKTASFKVESESVEVISREDAVAWKELIQRGFEFNEWSPLHPYIDGRVDRTYTPPSDFECVLVAEENGTPDGARFNSVLKFRKLAAVLHAVVSRASERSIHKAMALSLEFLVQFPHCSTPERNFIRNDCPPVIPYFTSDIHVTRENIHSIRSWYETAKRCDKPHRDRIDKAANFLNRGLNADDIEAYINYFITLDALFGQRGSVEASILQGVKALHLDGSFAEKAQWLFDLRNEIVHGGSRHLSEWPMYTRYTQHFRSKPMYDVRVLAEHAVLGVPYLFAS